MELRRLGEQAGAEIVRAEGDGVALALPAERVDALALDRLAREGTQAALREAARLYGGELLPGGDIGTEGFDAWLVYERGRFARLAAGVFARLAASCEAVGDWDGVASAAERWLAVDPACEEAHRGLMRVHARAGRRSDAIRQYQVCVEALRRGLDAEPEEATVELYRGIRERAAGVATMQTALEAGPAEPRDPPGKPSVAVLPFGATGAEAEGGGLADGLSHEVLALLSRMRSLFVIARGSTFRFRGHHLDPTTVGRSLGARYLVTGFLRTQAGRMHLTVELVEAASGGVVWADVFERRLDDVFAIQTELAARIVAALEMEIQATEMRRALARPTTSLDSWGSYHRGLWHMFRFTRGGNDTARGFFEQAIRLDPLCARSHAGLSFTHFQDAFLHRMGDWREEADLAYRFAERSVALDERDPTGHLVMGRALWLLERQEEAVEELNLSVELNPNYALGHYSIAFVHSQGGDPRTALEAADLAQRLSPFDPLMFGMMGARAMACLNLGDFAQAASWGERAARRPNAHAHIHAIAAFCCALAGRHDEALVHIARVKEAIPSYRCADFLAAFRTMRASVAALVLGVAPSIGVEP